MKKWKAAKLHRPATEVQVRLDLRPGPVSEFQKKLWHDLWTRLLASVREELKAESEATK